MGIIINDDPFPPELMVEACIEELNATGDLREASKTSLTASLDTAMKVLTDHNLKNDVAAINNLEAFINKLQAQHGKKIQGEVADLFIAKAKEIIVALS